MTEPEPRRELDGQLSMPIAVTVYNKRLPYDATECGNVDTKGERVRVAARPSPHHQPPQPGSVVDLGDGWRALVFVQAGHVRLSLIPPCGVAAHLSLPPAVARHLGGVVAARADIAELSEDGA